ncbi:MAG: choice-of-anchor tandem repeat GloVer-containing protein [Terracidiphilus sp.]
MLDSVVAGGPFPDGWLTSDFAGNLYGITGNGGSAVNSTNLGNGTIFKIDPRGDESVLYSFEGGAKGFSSFGSVIRDNLGNLYGTTFFGGDATDPACSAAGGCGVVFRLDPWGHYSVLHTFQGRDGANPSANLYMDERGDIYGTTTAGGNQTCNCGVVFKITLEAE